MTSLCSFRLKFCAARGQHHSLYLHYTAARHKPGAVCWAQITKHQHTDRQTWVTAGSRCSACNDNAWLSHSRESRPGITCLPPFCRNNLAALGWQHCAVGLSLGNFAVALTTEAVGSRSASKSLATMSNVACQPLAKLFVTCMQPALTAVWLDSSTDAQGQTDSLPQLT